MDAGASAWRRHAFCRDTTVGIILHLTSFCSSVTSIVPLLIEAYILTHVHLPSKARRHTARAPPAVNNSCGLQMPTARVDSRLSGWVAHARQRDSYALFFLVIVALALFDAEKMSKPQVSLRCFCFVSLQLHLCFRDKSTWGWCDFSPSVIQTLTRYRLRVGHPWHRRVALGRCRLAPSGVVFRRDGSDVIRVSTNMQN